ncbi:MAG TPA: ferredoxin reductase [Solirubrobacteraceae bacterium]|nr:ferredoxin reductase [Solirubrobacteraceae bacterium]
MEGAAILERLTPVAQRAPGSWQIGTLTSVKEETPRVKSFRISVPMWMAHLPGQHYEVRLTAEDGYRAQRSYSIASSPLDEGEVELTIDRLDDGEVSPYFDDVLEPGDEVELRGPFTSYFVWRGESPVLLLGGGSGVVPLMSMLRHRRRTMPELPMLLVYSVRTPEEVIYGPELGEDTVLTFTRRAAEGWSGHRGRIDAAMLAPVVPLFVAGIAFVCGSNGFVETCSRLLLELGFAPERVRTERFGPSG